MEVRVNNYYEFLVQMLSYVQDFGDTFESRAGTVKEVTNVLAHLKNNKQRELFMNNRGNNPIATVVETLWVLIGSNNAKWLSTYLPRALEYSDDSVSWLNGYGPKLRNWNNQLDQIMLAYNELKANPESRRCVLNIYDASTCLNVKTKDTACNLLLNFYIRDNKLNLSVMSRSMDLLWGSCVNFFEWSILQEMMANWLELEVGTYQHYITNLHLYQNMKDKYEKILETNNLAGDRFKQEVRGYLPVVIDKQEFIGMSDYYCTLINMFPEGNEVARHIYDNEVKHLAVIDNWFDYAKYCLVLGYYLKHRDKINNENLMVLVDKINLIKDSYAKDSLREYVDKVLSKDTK